MFGSAKHRSWLQHPGYLKKDAQAPDYSALASASEKSAQIMGDLGQKQLDFAKLQYEDALPIFQSITQSQLETQDQANAQAKDYYDYQQKTFRPLEEGLVADATKFNTDAYREQQASKAAAEAGTAFTNTQGATQRAMASMGVNPNSGRYASVQNQNALGLAAQRAGAMTGARQQADATGYARKMDAAGLGRGLAGASQGAYGLALNAGNSAGGNTSAPGNAYMAGMSQGAATIGSGRNMLQSGLSNVLSTQGGVYNSQTQANGEMTGAVVGGLFGLM